VTPPVARRPELALPWWGPLIGFIAYFVAGGLLGVAVGLGDVPKDELFYSVRFGVVGLAGYAVLAAITFALAHRTGDPLACLGLVRPETPRGQTVRLVLLAVLVLFVAEIALEPILHGGEEQGLSPTTYPGGTEAAIGVVLAGISVVIAAPFVEELFFRGAIFAAVRPRAPAWVAIVVSGVVFGAVHLVPAAFPVLALFGLVNATLYERTGSIWPGIAVHATFNGVAFAAGLAA
jgi:membrane protease YdiL (CAAX protease family)